MKLNIRDFGNLYGRPKELANFLALIKSEPISDSCANFTPRDLYHNYKVVAHICRERKAQEYYKPGDIMFTLHPLGWLEGQITWRIIKVEPQRIYLLATRPVAYMPFDADELSEDKDGKPHPKKYQVEYGNNSWETSAARQWLNSTAPKGKWWNPQHPWDAKPDEADEYDGFMCGLQQDFADSVRTYRAFTLCTDGGCTDSEDKFWLPSITELTGEANGGIMEGERLLQCALPTGFSWRLRSPHPGYSTNVYYVSTSGRLSNYTATYTGIGLAPACVIGEDH
jgi:hypothetical protein